MKGIAITLATREDAEAIAGIEKLTGIKLPRVDGEEPKAAPIEEAPREEKAPRSRSRSRAKPKAEAPRQGRSARAKGRSAAWGTPRPQACSQAQAEPRTRMTTTGTAQSPASCPSAHV